MKTGELAPRIPRILRRRKVLGWGLGERDLFRQPVPATLCWRQRHVKIDFLLTHYILA
jgi:hypothetical protein